MRETRDRVLARRSSADIVAAIDEAARRLAAADHPGRHLAETLLPDITGYSAPMIRLVLDRMIADWRSDVLEQLLQSELGDAKMLDEFVALPGGGAPRCTRAYGPRLAFHIFGGNVPGVAVTALVRSLLVKAATAGKLASGEPLLPVLFARTLAEVDPGIADCIALTYWPGGSEALEAVAFDAAEAVVVYGGAATEAAIRQRVGSRARLLVYGPRLSLGVVAREALTERAAGDLARDIAAAVATFDQQGCVSPHVIYAEHGGELQPRELAARLADALARLQTELPRGRISAAEAAAIHDLRGSAEFRGLAGEDVQLFAGAGTSFTVVHDADPAFALSCLNRVIWVKPVRELGDVVDQLRPFAHLLQTIGLAAPRPRAIELASTLGGLGASRITSLREMPWPPAPWHHDGMEPLRALLRWTDLEG